MKIVCNPKNVFESPMKKIKIVNNIDVGKHLEKIESTITDYFKTSEDIFSFKPHEIEALKKNNLPSIKLVKHHSQKKPENTRLTTARTSKLSNPPQNLEQKTILVKALFAHFEKNSEGFQIEGKRLNGNSLKEMNYIKSEYDEMKRNKSRNIKINIRKNSVTHEGKLISSIDVSQRRQSMKILSSKNIHEYLSLNKKILSNDHDESGKNLLSPIKVKDYNKTKSTNELFKGFEGFCIKLEENGQRIKDTLTRKYNLKDKTVKRATAMNVKLDKIKQEIKMFKPQINNKYRGKSESTDLDFHYKFRDFM
jgi:hypothetical protein